MWLSVDCCLHTQALESKGIAMRTRCLAAVKIVLLAHGVASAVQTGDEVYLQLQGELAKQYRAQVFGGKSPAGLTVEISSTVAQRLADGRLRIEHSSPCFQKGETPRLVTLSA